MSSGVGIPISGFIFHFQTNYEESEMGRWGDDILLAEDNNNDENED